jgi:signal transduction histidine kinase
LEDSQKNLWISTNFGLIKLIKAVAAKDSIEFKVYTCKDGLQSNQFNYNAYYKSSSGEMFFGGIKGFNTFTPDNIKENHFTPQLAITDFRIFNESVPIGKKFRGRIILDKSITETENLVLSYKDCVISFEFAALHYGSPVNNQYKYIMEGFDEDWINAGTTNKVTYTNLNPGKYKLKVKASNSDGIWNNEGASIQIIITPPIWETWWFKYLVFPLNILLFIFSISFFIAHRLRWKFILQVQEEKTKRKEAERTVKRIAHELGTPISEISVSLHALFGKLPEKYTHYLYKIASSAERMNAIMKAMLEIEILEELIESGYLKIDINSPLGLEVVNVNYLVQTAVMAVKETRVSENVNFSIQYKRDLKIHCNPYEIIQVFINLLKNSYDAFHEGKGEISIKSIDTKETIQVIFQDDGKGISEDIKDLIFEEGFSTRSGRGRGFGLSVAKNLVKKNNGKIEIKNDIINEKSCGCVAIVEFPKNC